MRLKVQFLLEAVKLSKTVLKRLATPGFLIPSGCTVLNLACSDDPTGAFTPGHMVNLIGDSSTGKTFLALTMLADIAHNSLFDDYRLIHDDVEEANEFDMVGSLEQN